MRRALPPVQPRPALLEVRGATASLPGTGVVLRGVSLVVEPGELAAVLGPNGAGKTTLLDACLGWRRLDRGEVLLKGRPLAGMSRRERGRMLTLVPQREAVRFSFSVEEYVVLGRAPHLPPLRGPGAADFEVVHEALAAAGIAHLAGRSITGLSGGEWQLVLIARSLAQQPALLLLDEPATHLDPAHQRLVIRLMERLAHRGIGILFTSHDPQTTASVADTVHLLKRGRIRAAGPPRTVLTAKALAAVYGVPFTVAWNGRSPHVRWER